MYMHVSLFPLAGYTSLISAETDTLRKQRGDVSALYPCVGNKLFRPVKVEKYKERRFKSKKIAK